MFDVQNSEIYTGTNIFIILYTENNIIKLNIADKDSIYNILNFYDIKQRDYKISVKPLEPIILYSPAITKYNKFNYDNCSNWFKIQIDDIIKNNPLSFNSIMTCSLYEQEFCDDKVYYKQYSENSNFIFAENTNFKLIFKVSGCMFDEKLSERVSLLILENNKILCNKPVNLYNKIILFSQKAMAIILDTCVSMFYADRIYLGNSIVSINDLNKRYFSNFDLMFDSFENIKFDAEGTIICKKFIVKDGTLIDLLSNNLYSKYLNLKESGGNNSVHTQGIIEHQRIIINVKNTSFYDNKCNINITVKDIKISKFLSNTGEIYASIYYQEANDNTLYKADVCINSINFLEGILCCEKNYGWNNNVFCADTIIKL